MKDMERLALATTATDNDPKGFAKPERVQDRTPTGNHRQPKPTCKEEAEMPAKATTATRKKSNVFTEEEKAAMQELAQERKRASRRDPAAEREEGERDVLAKIAEMAPADRVLAKRIHAIVKATAPELLPRTWYGLPAYAKEGKVICFFKAASKYKERYATFGFDMAANVDEGTMWPTSWGLTKLTAADEKKIAALVKKAVS
jgi:uncharacterized protein YdhG (YjbR/CyaY superfamily)